MTGVPYPGGKFTLVEGRDVIQVWLAPDGLHTQRTSESSKGKILEHAEIVTKYDELIPKAEGQAVMRL